MKNRLLEDFGDSQSAVPLRPVRRAQAGAPPAPPPQAAPPPVPAPAGAAATSVRQRAGVWRSRAPDEAPAPPPSPPPQAAPAQRVAPPRVEPTMAPSAAPEAPRATPRVSPEFASFSSREPDWSIPPQPEPPPWTERWGRKALGWTIGLAAVVAVAGTAAWMVQETRVESTLAVVADHTPARPEAPAPAAPAAAPVPEPGSEDLPPLKLLSPAAEATPPIAAGAAVATLDDAPVQAAPVGAEKKVSAPEEAAPAVISSKPVPQQRPAKPAAKRVQERRVAASAPAKSTRPETKKPPSKPVREPAVARAPALPARTVSADQPDPESPLAETLRLCRAAGYHATACLKRGCEATRFGLVCRG
ncbi:MAG: hypothetical protein ACRYF7_07575 [Janthinobacterium lividum]